MRRSPLLSKPEFWLFLIAVAGALLGALATYGREAMGRLTPDEESWRIQDEENTVLVFQAASRGVVMVTTYRPGARVGSGASGQSRVGNGSGFFIDLDGHIVTNDHVIDGATSIEVQTYSGRVVTATVIGSDRLTDLALLAVDIPKEEVFPLVLADFEEVEVGQKAIVVGSPMATGSDMGLDRSPTVTTGIISAIDRSLPIESKTRPGVNDFTVEHLIQTDAAVNPGNSGGPLLNSRGEVVGIVTAILDSAAGIGFAIPSQVVSKVVPQIIENGSATWAFMGVDFYSIRDLVKGLDANGVAKLGLGATSGAILCGIREDGPADNAGLRGSTGTVIIDGEEYPVGGDIITAIDGAPVLGLDLSEKILLHRPGDTVTLEILRDGEKMSVEVVLGSR